MQPLPDNYFNAYRSLEIDREMRKACWSPSFIATAGHSPSPHRIIPSLSMLSTASRRIAANKIVILTGAGGEFMPGIDLRLSKMSPIPAFGARFMTKAFRLWRT